MPSFALPAAGKPRDTFRPAVVSSKPLGPLPRTTRFSVRRAETDQDLHRVYALIRQAYVAAGYWGDGSHAPAGYGQHYDSLAETCAFVAETDGQIVGTLSLTIDGREGLPVNDEFRAQVERVRAEGRPVAMVWRFTTVRRFRNNISLATALIRAAVSEAMHRGVGVGMMILHQKHLRFYQRQLNFREVARLPSLKGFHGLLPVLVRCEVPKIPAYWADGNPPVSAVA